MEPSSRICDSKHGTCTHVVRARTEVTVREYVHPILCTREMYKPYVHTICTYHMFKRTLQKECAPYRPAVSCFTVTTDVLGFVFQLTFGSDGSATQWNPGPPQSTLATTSVPFLGTRTSNRVFLPFLKNHRELGEFISVHTRTDVAIYRRSTSEVLVVLQFVGEGHDIVWFLITASLHRENEFGYTR